MTDDTPQAATCEHYWASHVLGGFPIAVRTCQLCRQVDWDDLKTELDQAFGYSTSGKTTSSFPATSYYEPDEPVDDLIRRFDDGVKGVTARPPGCVCVLDMRACPVHPGSSAVGEVTITPDITGFTHALTGVQLAVTRVRLAEVRAYAQQAAAFTCDSQRTQAITRAIGREVLKILDGAR